MWEVTDAYRSKFYVAEEWRKSAQDLVARQGYVDLIDFHRRVRLEATSIWYDIMISKFGNNMNDPLYQFGLIALKRIQRRSLNQAVNSLIQGGCAALAKRSILNMNKYLETSDIRARFMQPIHDELLYNVHKDDVVRFIREARRVMCDHPDVIHHVLLDCTASIGLNFRGFSMKSNPIGQFELDEAPEAPWISGELVDSKLSDEMIQVTINNLFLQREMMR
jgi:DNA polymerase I-like protein with 3'-5' exonuclease and polymerase domains